MAKFRFYTFAALLAACPAAQAQPGTAHAGQMERLTRGVVVVPSQKGGNSNFVSWRLLGTDDENTTFDVVRDGNVIKSGIADRTNYVDDGGFKTSKYQIIAKVDGMAVDTTEAVTPWDNVYTRIQLSRPAGGVTPDNVSYTYSPNDCSVGDADGDGEYEIFVKWDPSNAKDNSHSGYTGNVYIDCYKLDGTKLWRVDLGKNIRAGAHYTQFLVYDFDKDGKAEMICKTAPGSKDSRGYYVSAAATDEKLKDEVSNRDDYRNSGGYILSGPEYLTVFNGETGHAVHTVYYNPNRQFGLGEVSDGMGDWGDTYGNRGDRYLATVAYLDGPDKRPSAVMCRGYYTRAYLWAVDFDGKELKTKWLHGSISDTKVELTDADGKKTTTEYTKNTRPDNSGSKTAYGNGNHNLSCADVDGDGCDEIIYGSAAIDNDGTLLYATGYGHGDAIHVSDLIPDRPGLEVFQIHESSPYGWDIHDAATGEIIHSWKGGGDNGRGVAADIAPDNYGFEFWSASDGSIRSAKTGEVVSTSGASQNFRAYWDGDLQDELFDGGKMDKWGTGRIYPVSGKNFYDFGSSCNGTKATPNLLADILGDWREEVVLHGDDYLVLFTTNVESEFRTPTLMHDHTYRLGVAWQNVAYNQPPHLGYYLPEAMKTRYVSVGEGTFDQSVTLGDSMRTVVGKWVYCTAPRLVKSVAPDGTTVVTESKTDYSTVSGFKFTIDQWLTKTFTLEGKPSMAGDYEFIIESGNNVVDNSVRLDTIRVHSVITQGIDGMSAVRTGWVSMKDNVITDRVGMSLSLEKAQTVYVDIYDSAGSRAFSRRYSVAGTQSLTVAGLDRLGSGIYVIRVKSAEGTYTKKLIKR